MVGILLDVWLHASEEERSVLLSKSYHFLLPTGNLDKQDLLRHDALKRAVNELRIKHPDFAVRFSSYVGEYQNFGPLIARYSNVSVFICDVYWGVAQMAETVLTACPNSSFYSVQHSFSGAAGCSLNYVWVRNDDGFIIARSDPTANLYGPHPDGHDVFRASAIQSSYGDHFLLRVCPPTFTPAPSGWQLTASYRIGVTNAGLGVIYHVKSRDVLLSPAKMRSYNGWNRDMTHRHVEQAIAGDAHLVAFIREARPEFSYSGADPVMGTVIMIEEGLQNTVELNSIHGRKAGFDKFLTPNEKLSLHNQLRSEIGRVDMKDVGSRQLAGFKTAVADAVTSPMSMIATGAFCLGVLFTMRMALTAGFSAVMQCIFSPLTEESIKYFLPWWACIAFGVYEACFYAHRRKNYGFMFLADMLVRPLFHGYVNPGHVGYLNAMLIHGVWNMSCITFKALHPEMPGFQMSMSDKLVKRHQEKANFLSCMRFAQGPVNQIVLHPTLKEPVQREIESLGCKYSRMFRRVSDIKREAINRRNGVVMMSPTKESLVTDSHTLFRDILGGALAFGAIASLTLGVYSYFRRSPPTMSLVGGIAIPKITKKDADPESVVSVKYDVELPLCVDIPYEVKDRELSDDYKVEFCTPSREKPVKQWYWGLQGNYTMEKPSSTTETMMFLVASRIASHFRSNTEIELSGAWNVSKSSVFDRHDVSERCSYSTEWMNEEELEKQWMAHIQADAPQNFKRYTNAIAENKSGRGIKSPKISIMLKEDEFLIRYKQEKSVPDLTEGWWNLADPLEHLKTVMIGELRPRPIYVVDYHIIAKTGPYFYELANRLKKQWDGRNWMKRGETCYYPYYGAGRTDKDLTEWYRLAHQVPAFYPALHHAMAGDDCAFVEHRGPGDIHTSQGDVGKFDCSAKTRFQKALHRFYLSSGIPGDIVALNMKVKQAPIHVGKGDTRVAVIHHLRFCTGGCGSTAAFKCPICTRSTLPGSCQITGNSDTTVGATAGQYIIVADGLDSGCSVQDLPDFFFSRGMELEYVEITPETGHFLTFLKGLFIPTPLSPPGVWMVMPSRLVKFSCKKDPLKLYGGKRGVLARNGLSETLKNAMCVHIARISQSYLTYALSPLMKKVFEHFISICLIPSVKPVDHCRVAGELHQVVADADDFYEMRYPGWKDFCKTLLSVREFPAFVSHPCWDALIMDYTSSRLA